VVQGIAEHRQWLRGGRGRGGGRLAAGLLVCLTVGACASDDGDGDSVMDAPVVDEPAADADPAPEEPDDLEGDVTDEAEPEPPAPPAPELPPLQGLELALVAEGFDGPIGVAAEPGTQRLAVIERSGRAWLVDPDGTVGADPFVDLRDVLASGSIEQGLLGIAYHPAWPADDRIFLYHSLPTNDNVLVAYRSAGGDHTRLDPASRQELLTIDKEADQVRHNGGHLLFGPDGMLYVSVGDGARASVNGQDPGTLLGTILRLDVDGGDPYAIPPDNPFADGIAGAPEVWWFGLRNPWRFTIDEASGLALIGDVGQETWEEVNVVPLDRGGLNFGWPSYEARDTFYGNIQPVGEVTFPALEIAHDDTDQGCSVTGGVVARDPLLPEFEGRYWFADWCFGWIRSATLEGELLVDIEDHTDELPGGNVASFGVDQAGAVLVVDWAGGTIQRITGRR
jgi:glucose/arabinose dehydrogenase